MNALVLLLLMIVNSWASCPDFSGSFQWENPDPTDPQGIALDFRQKGCESATATYDHGKDVVFQRFLMLDGVRRLHYDLGAFRLYETHLWKDDRIFVLTEMERFEDEKWTTEYVHSFLFFESPDVFVEESFSLDSTGKPDDRTKSVYRRSLK